MDYQILVRDFALRTRKNLDALRTLQKSNPDAEVYEVTQLINSMLGLLIFPQQRYVNRIEKVALDELARQGWPVPRIVGDYSQVKDLNQLVRYLRNSIAHCNIEFIGDGYGKIQGLQVWNTRAGATTWKAQLTIEDIEKISQKFIEMLLQDSAEGADDISTHMTKIDEGRLDDSSILR